MDSRRTLARSRRQARALRADVVARPLEVGAVGVVRSLFPHHRRNGRRKAGGLHHSAAARARVGWDVSVPAEPRLGARWVNVVRSIGPHAPRAQMNTGRSRERTEDFAALLQLLIAGCVADAEVRIALAEDVAGDDQNVVLDRLRHEIAGADAGGGLREN